MNEANFCRRVSFFATGDHFLAEKEIPLAAVRDASNGLSPFGEDGGTGSTAITPDAVVDGISFDDGETATLQFTIPQDYEQSRDKCALRLHVIPSADGTDTTDIGITAAQKVFRAGSAIITTGGTAKAEAATAGVTPRQAREVVLDMSGTGYRPGDVVQRILDVNNGGTTELVLVGIDLIYGSCFAAFNDDDRFRKMGTEV